MTPQFHYDLEEIEQESIEPFPEDTHSLQEETPVEEKSGIDPGNNDNTYYISKLTLHSAFTLTRLTHYYD